MQPVTARLKHCIGRMHTANRYSNRLSYAEARHDDRVSDTSYIGRRFHSDRHCGPCLRLVAKQWPRPQVRVAPAPPRTTGSFVFPGTPGGASACSTQIFSFATSHPALCATLQDCLSGSALPPCETPTQVIGPMTVPTVMTISEVAEYLRVSERSINRWRRMRQGPPWTTAGKQVRYLREDVDAYLRKRQQRPLRED